MSLTYGSTRPRMGHTHAQEVGTVSRFDSMVSAEAWDDLVRQYGDAGGEGADDHTLAEILRQKMLEVEGE